MGFGDFMSGMQGGMSAMDDLKNSRLRRKLYDQVLTEGNIELDAKDFDREKQGLPKLRRFDTSDTFVGKLGDKLDPVLSRFMEKLGRGTGATESPVADTLPTAAEVNPEAVPLSAEDFGAAYDEGIALADGKRPIDELGGWADDGAKNADPKKARPKLTEEEFARRRAAAKADLTGKADQIKPVEYTSKANRATIDRVGADVTPRGAIPESAPKGRIARGVTKVGGFLKGTGAGLLAAGATGAALENSLAPDEKIAEYYRRIGRPGGEKNAGPLETTGVRAMGVLQDVGRAFLPKVVEDKLFPYLGESEQAAPPPEAAPQEAIPTSSGPTNPRRYPGQGAARRAASAAPSAPAAEAVPTAPTEVDPLAGFDVTQVNAADIPNFSNNDWVQHRKDMMDSYIMHGMSYAEAWDKVDQQVIATQQRGFMHFGNQARALLANGDLKGAATAVRAAFQYFPSTTDLQVGEYNGHLVAFGVDEETGEQVGTPMVVTPEFLDSALMNFSDRKAWTEFAQDNRRMDQADIELEQGSRRLDLMEESLGVERENALTRRLDAIGGGLAGGTGSSLKETDIATARKQLNDWAYAIGGGEDADPALPAALTALAEAEYKRRGGDLSTIVMRLEEMMRSPGGPDTILAAARRLASGQ